MKIYLASMYNQKPKMQRYAQQLRGLDIEVTASWLSEPHGPKTQLSDVHPDQLGVYAHKDLFDVGRSDLLIFFSQKPTKKTARGGRHVEFGFALAKRIPILVVGPRENIFHYLDWENLRSVKTWRDAKKIVRAAKKSKRRLQKIVLTPRT